MVEDGFVGLQTMLGLGAQEAVIHQGRRGLVITIDTLSKTKISPVLGDGDREFSSKSASEVIQVRTLEGNPV